MTKNVDIVWVGFHEEGRYALKAICEAGYNVKGIICLNPKEAVKRSGVWSFGDLALEYKIPVHKIVNINEKSSLFLLNSLKPDVLCVIGWSQILSKAVLNTADLIVGAHASLLPKNRGSAPINWSLIKGEEETGNSLIQLSEGVDTGDILAQTSIPISLFDSCKTLYDKVAESNANMLIEVLDLWKQGRLVRRPQCNFDEKVLPRRKPEDGQIDWNQKASDIYNFIRALAQPYPGAFTFNGQEKVIIWRASWSPQQLENGLPGSVCGSRYGFDRLDCSVDINCRAGVISIHEIELGTGEVILGKKLIEFFSSAQF